MPQLWTYKGARKKYPVQMGEVWKVGDHILICGDLEGDTTVLKRELKTYQPDLMFVDPPWDNQIASSFRARSGVDERPVDCASLITNILGYAKEMELLCFFEGGVRRKQMNRDCIKAVGGSLAGEWNICYTNKRTPCMLWALDFRKEPKQDYPNFEGMSEIEVEDAVMNTYKPKRVFDTCGGLGGTAIAAQYAGIPSVTHELSPFKMAEAIKNLVKISGTPAERVS